MTQHILDRQLLFNYFKTQGIVEEIQVSIENNSIRIYESKNSINGGLYEIVITDLAESCKYWLLNPENDTTFESKKCKTDRVLLIWSENILQVVLIEMKSSGKPDKAYITEKYKHTLEWAYCLLSLLRGKENNTIKVKTVLCCQNQTIDWKNPIKNNIFDSTTIITKPLVIKTNQATDISISLNINDIL